ncbi:MAG: ACT domain-containing protein, partial [Bauldia litoralis]
IEEALEGTLRMPEQIDRKAQRKGRLKAFSVETTIAVDNDLSNQYTVIEAAGIDRAGLLFSLTRVISDLNLNIASAHVSTFGERVVDVFYVTDLTGIKITNASRQAAIRRRLKAAFDGTPVEEARPARRMEPA